MKTYELPDGSTLNLPESTDAVLISKISDSLKALGVFETDLNGRIETLEQGGGYSERALSAHRMGLHTVPDSDGALNFVKRCRQFTEIEWTPAVDLPRCLVNNGETDIYEGKFTAGKTYRGVPYSNTVNALKPKGRQYVGFDVSLEAFVTAAGNKNSFLSKESAFKDVGDLSGGATAMGCVCSSFASYAYGLSSVYTTETITSVSGFTSVGAVTTIAANKLAIGQLLNHSGDHSAMITDVAYDEDGNAVWIEVSEATDLTADNSTMTDPPTGGFCMRRGFDLDTFRWYFYYFTVYSYAGIDDIAYTKSPFVNVGDEMDCFRSIYPNLMPYMGNGYVFKSGNIVSNKLIVSNHDFAYVRVLKDGEVFQTTAISSSTTEVAVNFSAVGSYEAYLCNMSGSTVTNESVWHCTWEVVS